MSFGFSPKHIQEYKLENLDKEHFLVFAIEAALKLDWDVSFISGTGFIAYTKFSMGSWSEEISVNIDNGVAIIKSECTGSQLIDWGKNKKNVEALLTQMESLKSVMTREEIETKLAEIRQADTTKENDVFSKPPSATKGKITGFFSIFKPTEGYYASPILININMLIFIWMAISGVNILLPDSQDLLNWGANFRPVTLEGEWWRLFTSCFLHVGILHLLFNMYALLYIGLLLEPYLGRTRFLAAYIISGIAASTASLWWHDLTISAGASGAIFGMYGVFLALLSTNLLDKSVKKSFMASILIFVGYNLLNGLKPNSGIDNAAHIGGLLSGLVIGYAYVPGLKQNENKSIKFSTIGALTFVLLFFSSMVYRSLPNDIGKYETAMERFVNMESMALEVYKLPQGTPDSILLYEIKNRGLYYWHENLKLLDSLDSLELPSPITERNNTLKKYCEYRIRSYELIYKAVEEKTNKYDGEISEYYRKIEMILKELSENQAQ